MQRLEHHFEPIWVKALIIGGLSLLMLWPLARVESLVSERQELQHQAYGVICAGFGGMQTVGGPILSVDTQDVLVDPSAKDRAQILRAGAPMHLLPDSLRIESEVRVEVRNKGIYSIPVYVSRFVVTGKFTPESVARVLTSNDDMKVLPAHAALQLPLPGVKYLRGLTLFAVNGRPLRVTNEEVGGLSALSARIDLESIDRRIPLDFRAEFELAGSESLNFLPLASDTIVSAKVGWPHPDFEGAFLPISHENAAKGYSADWHILDLNRALPQTWRGTTVSNSALLATSFGVRMFQPSDIYTQNYRATRYGILFIAITFTCFFAWEHAVRGLRLHPMQYLMVGLALATFYLLLLALSEHVGFAMAYTVAAGSLVALITTYIGGATRDRRAASWIGAALGAAYAALFVILLSEDYALLFGSLLVFAILSALMLATRRLDWSRARYQDSPDSDTPSPTQER
jgi:inner membrane protein